MSTSPPPTQRSTPLPPTSPPALANLLPHPTHLDGFLIPNALGYDLFDFSLDTPEDMCVSFVVFEGAHAVPNLADGGA